jgi:predicted PurR-regulated permease PerM
MAAGPKDPTTDPPRPGHTRTTTTETTGSNSGTFMRTQPAWLQRFVIFVLLAVAAFKIAEWMFASLKGFLGLLFLSWLFAISIEPVVSALARRGMKRGLATFLVLVVLLFAILAFLGVFGKLLFDQLAQLVQVLPDAITNIVDWVNRNLHTNLDANQIVNSVQLDPAKIQAIAAQLANGAFGVLNVITSILRVVFQLLTVLLFAYYISAESPRFRATVSSWFPPQQQRIISEVWEIAVAKTGGYLVSRLILAILSAVCTSVFLWILGIPYFLPLGIWTGLLSQFLPTIGTYLAGALPVAIALLESPIDAVWVLIFIAVYQQIENYFFAPKVTARTVQIHPAVAFGAVIAGGALFGAMGALVSIPIVAAIQSVIETYGRRYELIPELKHEDLDTGEFAFVEEKTITETGPTPVAGTQSEPESL